MPWTAILRRAAPTIVMAARVGAIVAFALVATQPGVQGWLAIGTAALAVLSALVLWQHYRLGRTIVDLGWTDGSLVWGVLAALFAALGISWFTLIPLGARTPLAGFGTWQIGIALCWLAKAVAGAQVCENGIDLDAQYGRWERNLSYEPTDWGFALKVRWLVFTDTATLTCPPERRAEVAALLAGHVGAALRPSESGA